MISNNGNGTSQDTSQIPDGYLTNYYSGQNETGTPQGSGSTTFDGSGNSVTMRYSGLNRTGASGGTTVTLQDGAGDYVTLGLLATNINFGATRVNGGGGGSSFFDDQLLYLGGSDVRLLVSSMIRRMIIVSITRTWLDIMHSYEEFA